MRQRILATGIGPDAFDCDLGLALEGAGYFNLSAPQARDIVKSVAEVTATWRDAAAARAARPGRRRRMQSAFEHEYLARALAF